jgi:peptide subunit release factor 1 (eRF1)
MMTRAEIRELATFQANETKGACALSFYFQPDPPQDRSHRREAIVAKDIVKQALKSAAATGKNGSLHADLDRVLDLATNLRGKQGRAVFACSAQNFWKEYELPPRLGATNIYLQSQFQLKPLAALLGAQPALCVAVVDRQRARFFDLRLDQLSERGAIVHMLSRSASSYGYNGYDAGHAERRIADEALQHFKAVSDRLLADYEKGVWDRLIVGCLDANWPEFESTLHPYDKERLIGRFSADVASVSNEQIRDHSGIVLDNWITHRASTKADQALEFARANGHGVSGLRRVLQSLEKGEVQSIFLAEDFSAPAVQCTNCGHLDAHIIASCVACGRATRELADVCDAIVPIAIRRDIELFYLRAHEGLDRAGSIAALLRFRSDQTMGRSRNAALAS